MAFVISRDGAIVGYQTKNQIPLEEEPFYVPDGRRRLFEVDGVPFGITICHEGWRYPEAVRWAATRGARLVFHPQLTGSDQRGVTIDRWGDPGSPYYEKAMVARSVENTIYFASVNYAMRYQDSATSLVGPGRGVPGARSLRPGAASGARRRSVAGHRTLRAAVQPGPLSTRVTPAGSGTGPAARRHPG